MKQLRLFPEDISPMPVFPTLDSLQEVFHLAEARLPIVTKNDITVLLMIYHNTLLKAISEENKGALPCK